MINEPDYSRDISITLDIEGDSETFVFRAAKARDLGRLNLRAQRLRAEDEPDSAGSEVNLEPLDANLYRGLALLETLLVSTTAEWVYSATPGPNGEKVVDTENLPTWGIFPIVTLYTTFVERFVAMTAKGA